MTIKTLISFFKTDIWHIRKGDIAAPLFYLINILRAILLTARSFVDARITRTACALSFSTMLAIVPVVAVVFAVARGFGFSKHIEIWFRDLLVSQPQVAEVIIGFVNSYLVNVKSGIILGIGLLVMLFTVVMLIINVETAFNDIWKVKSSRSIISTIIDYVAFFFLLPIVLIVTSGFSLYVSTVTKEMGEFMAPLVRLLLSLSPYVVMSLIFMGIYILLPNTKVKISCAVWPGILAGIAMQILQLLYIHSQIWVTSYNAIYGSFAALPLFMLWLQVSWIICLVGVYLCYTNQNMEQLALVSYNQRIGQKYQMMVSAMLLSRICKSFANGEKACTPLSLKESDPLVANIPTHIILDMLQNMTEAGSRDSTPAYMPAEDISNITVGVMVDRLETVGGWTLDNWPMKEIIGKNDQWRKVLEMRSNYLRELRSVRVTDL